jgi:hypothetical protein
MTFMVVTARGPPPHVVKRLSCGAQDSLCHSHPSPNTNSAEARNPGLPVTLHLGGYKGPMLPK